MYGLAIYSLKVGACLAVFYLFFKLLLSRETLHRFNRVVVLGAMSLSFVLPLCVITVTHELPVVPESLFADIPVAAADNTAVPTEEPFAWERLFGALYLAGALGMLAATVVSVRRVMRLVRSGRHETLDSGITLVRLPQPVTPFSWWRYVVISEADYAACGREIITHERAHLRLHHSWDLLLTDLAGCLQWFNPAMWLLRRELRAIHEYEADEAVLDSGVDARQYQLILIKKAAGGRWYSVANSFNHSKLKNRITMMLQKRSSRWAGAKALFVVPLAGLALGAFAETVYVLPQDKGMQEIAEMQISEQPDSSSMSVSVDKNRRQVIIRGAGGKTVTGEPLCLVDGKVVADLNKEVDLARIQSITVLKDESTSEYIAQYGDKAKNGVVLITTKRSKQMGRVDVTAKIRQ
ncbi:MAG: M56 family peptidase, partial [Alistipes sp.]|nr:M56 family peptidase [Alistipes sp.]